MSKNLSSEDFDKRFLTGVWADDYIQMGLIGQTDTFPLCFQAPHAAHPRLRLKKLSQ